MTVIALPRILREKLTDEGAEPLVELFDKATAKSEETMLEHVEVRFERRLAEVKSDIIKWMFIFIFGQFWAIIGVLFAFFNK